MKFDKTNVAVWCYNQWQVEPIQKAIKEFKDGVAFCEGSEQNRYSNILVDLLDIKENNIEKLKSNGWRFYKKGDIYFPVASDQEEWAMKKTDIITFENKKIR